MSPFCLAFSRATTADVAGAFLLTSWWSHSPTADMEGRLPITELGFQWSRGLRAQCFGPLICRWQVKEPGLEPGFHLGPRLIPTCQTHPYYCLQCLCLPDCTLGPLTPPAPLLTHLIRFITTAREYLNCLLFLALRLRERSLPDSGAPLLPRGPRGDSICSVSRPAQPPALSQTLGKTQDQNEGDKRHRKMGRSLGVFV